MKVTNMRGGQTITPDMINNAQANGNPWAIKLPGNPEILAYDFYDRVNYTNAGTTSLNFFSVPKGQSATLISGGTAASKAKTLRDTNIVTANTMSGVDFLFEGLSLTYIPLTTAIAGTPLQNLWDDISKIAHGGYLQIIFLNKPYVEIPLIRIPSVVKAAPMMMTTANNVTFGGATGFGDGNNCFAIDPYLMIEKGDTFTCTAVFDGTALSTSNSIDLQLFWHGHVIRPAQ